MCFICDVNVGDFNHGIGYYIKLKIYQVDYVVKRVMFPIIRNFLWPLHGRLSKLRENMANRSVFICREYWSSGFNESIINLFN